MRKKTLRSFRLGRSQNSQGINLEHETIPGNEISAAMLMSITRYVAQHYVQRSELKVMLF